jgi:hypothetical protein
MNAYKVDSDTVTTVHAILNGGCEPASGVLAPVENRAGYIGASNQRHVGIRKRLTDTRPVYPYIFFNKSPLQLRRIGALGGKAYGRNQRARSALVPTTPTPVPLRAARRQTTAEAVAVLDARFPWLRSVEQRRSRDQPSPLR